MLHTPATLVTMPDMTDTPMLVNASRVLPALYGGGQPSRELVRGSIERRTCTRSMLTHRVDSRLA